MSTRVHVVSVCVEGDWPVMDGHAADTDILGTSYVHAALTMRHCTVLTKTGEKPDLLLYTRAISFVTSTACTFSTMVPSWPVSVTFGMAC